jgi:pyruvate formate-lyase/glycerol dehydratase family glycyl radical enzyme
VSRSTNDEIRRDVVPPRVRRLQRAVQESLPGICAERALIWTSFFRDPTTQSMSTEMRMAEALRRVLREKSVHIYADELVVGNFSSKRVAGAIYPELHGVAMLADLSSFPTRAVNPLQINPDEAARLKGIRGFWLRRSIPYLAYRAPWRKIRLVADQLKPRYYTLNELGGIAHIVPDYSALLEIGTDGLVARARSARMNFAPGSQQVAFLDAVESAAVGLAEFGERYAHEAVRLAEAEDDPVRRGELFEIAESCRRVPRHPARSFAEALQSMTFAQIAITLESLDNGVSPGRMDQLLWPYYERDVAAGTLTRERAFELVAAFCIKLCEVIPVFSDSATRLHGGLMSGQAVTLGGVDADGRDATNELSYVFLEVADALRMRQPNFHVRLHRSCPDAFTDQVTSMLCDGANTPALYNDDVIVQALLQRGYDEGDALGFAICGCVEPVAPGLTFGSTDAALFNLPIILELALNEGRRFSSRWRTGARTPPVTTMRTMQDVVAAFERQLEHMVARMVGDLHAVEIANKRFHPTPMTSMLLSGCLERGTCSTAGGARYNSSGIQCVGPADTGDSLVAIERSVFVDRRVTLPHLVASLKTNLADRDLSAYLRSLGKFGNDDPWVDGYTAYVLERFSTELARYRSSRGGPYVAGVYSMTTHAHFGSVTGALPSGRPASACFASGLSPENGMDCEGPTAVFNSVNRVDTRSLSNGVNLNMLFDQVTLRGANGRRILSSLVRTYFRGGGTQVQTNILDPAMLIEARDDPSRHPNLLVRISGYSAYFNDLTPTMKDEIIRRTTHSGTAH